MAPPNRAAPQLPEKYGAKDYFTYVINIATLAASGQQPGQFTVDAGWDFLWSKATFLAIDDAGAVVANPNVTITITDTGTGRAMSNAPIPVPAIFGTGALPFILPTQKLFAARATVSVAVVNNDAAVNFGNIYLVFVGTQLFLR